MAAAGRYFGSQIGGWVAGVAGAETGPLDLAIIMAGRYVGGYVGSEVEDILIIAANRYKDEVGGQCKMKNAPKGSGDGGMPGNNQDQNKQARDAAKAAKLGSAQERVLHDAISGQNFSYQQFLKLRRRSRVEDTNLPVNTAIDFFNRLMKKECWSTIAGSGAGSRVTLAFGGRIPRQRQLRNPTLSQEQREFDGEFVLFVKDSSWKIFDNNRLLCTSDDNNEPNGPMLSGLQSLVGKAVSNVSITSNCGGLKLEFTEGLSIQLDGLEPSDDLESYSLFYLGNALADIGGK